MGETREQKRERLELFKEGLKRCNVGGGCGEIKSASEFGKNAKSKDGLTSYCRQCCSRAAKQLYRKNKDRDPEWRKTNPEYNAEWRRKNPHYRMQYRYGLSQSDYNKLLEDQNHVCAICGGDNNGKTLVVDHDHSCCPGQKSCGKCVRQLLCGSCNSMIGYARDNPEILEGGAKYVKRHARSKISEEILD